jgi:hypothetical protein
MVASYKTRLILNIKNLYGWRTKRRIVVFPVDDYGNVRVHSKQARESMDKAGLKALNRFDAFDTLETRQDLEMLFDVLTSVRDKNGRHAVFTPFALPCNIDFEKMAAHNYQHYYYELLPQTFEKLAHSNPSAYTGAWGLWQEGIEKKLLAPQFHGREHFNLKVFEEKLASEDAALLTALKNRSYTSIIDSGYPTINTMGAFDFWEYDENLRFEKIISEGLEAFQKVFGYKSVHFISPVGRENPIIHNYLFAHGIDFIDTPLIKKEHWGRGKYKTVLNYTGKKNKLGQSFLVRNVVFEPGEKNGFDWVNYTMKQIEAAFRWNRPAVISSHRVNFCGHIDPKNREKGISALKTLLKRIVHRWPDVEFVGSGEFCGLMKKSSP